MITYINESNSSLYQELYAKANQVIQKYQDSSDFDPNKNKLPAITTLNQYYASLERLMEIPTNNPNADYYISEDVKRSFTRLPLDEDVFEINADDRTIKVPTVFQRNGVGVEGDFIAETVYFTIDRFYDATDLGSDDKTIVIQWTKDEKDEEGNLITYLSANYGKDVVTLPRKIIFGWPITKEMTAAAGKIRFAVRIYQSIKHDNSDPELVYSFSTLPAEVNIKSTLQYDVLSTAKIDQGSLITGRIHSSGIYDEATPAPKPPVITTDLYVLGHEGENKVDLENGELRLGVYAKVGDEGSITYDWKQYWYDYQADPESFYSLSSTSLEDDEMMLVEAKELKDNELYYLNDSDLTATPYSIDGLSALYDLAHDGEDNYIYAEGLGFKLLPIADDESEQIYQKFYKPVNVITVTEAGQYTVDPIAHAGFNSTPLPMDRENAITVPGPKPPVINTPASTLSIPVDEEGIHIPITVSPPEDNEEEPTYSATLTVNASSPELAEETNPQVSLSYVWKKQVVENNETIYKDVSEIDGLNYEINSSNNLILYGLSDPLIDDMYKVTVSNERNGASNSKDSLEYRVTQLPVAPVIKYGDGENDVTSGYNSNEVVELNRYSQSQDQLLTFSVNKPAITDNVYFLWMKVNADSTQEGDVDPSTGKYKLQVDLDDLVAELGTNPAGNADFVVPFNEAGTEQSYVLDGSNPVFTELSAYLQQYSTLGTLLTEDENHAFKPSLVIPRGATGIYYCIVVNVLNKHRTISISPFYNVTVQS